MALEPLWQHSCCCCCCVSEGFVGISCTVSKLFLEIFLGLSCDDFPRILPELMFLPLSPFRYNTQLRTCSKLMLCDWSSSRGKAQQKCVTGSLKTWTGGGTCPSCHHPQLSLCHCGDMGEQSPVTESSPGENPAWDSLIHKPTAKS